MQRSRFLILIHVYLITVYQDHSKLLIALEQSQVQNTVVTIARLTLFFTTRVITVLICPFSAAKSK
jgi:hypothetical protein